MMLVLAHGQITGWAPLPFDVDAYVNSWSGWSLAIVASALAALLLIAPLGALLALKRRTANGAGNTGHRHA